MNPLQEAAASAKRTSHAQDKRTPFVINIVDGRLIPNTRLTRRNPNYRLYRGDVNAPLDERMRYLASAGLTQEIGPAVDEPAFDIGKAGKEELIAFAAAEYGVALDAGMHLATLRSKVSQMAKAAQGSENLG